MPLTHTKTKTKQNKNGKNKIMRCECVLVADRQYMYIWRIVSYISVQTLSAVEEHVFEPKVKTTVHA